MTTKTKLLLFMILVVVLSVIFFHCFKETTSIIYVSKILFLSITIGGFLLAIVDEIIIILKRK